MDKLAQKSKLNLSKFRITAEELGKRNIIIGCAIGTFIAITPFLFYLYESVPKTKVWSTFLFDYDSVGWGDANLSIWILTGKAIPLVLIFIWFFTNRHWWYHSLLVPITMYLYQVIGLLTTDTGFIDQFDLIYMVPIMSVIIPSLYLIRARMFNQLNEANKTLEELEEEFMIKPTTVWGKVKQYF